MSIEYDGKVPIYLQIISNIKMDIINGRLKSGDRMPSVREMAEKARVNPNTVQRVYQELEREGITYTQRGTGSFITEDLEVIKRMKFEMSQGIIKAYVDSMKNLGLQKDDMLLMLKNYLEEDGDGTDA